ncbi:hypothetical protein FXB78_04415 [Aggregatibacter actinomycetemcomitans]|nr:hypothetical protein FXN58_11690 [Aggregatibacter actinomycetemcomitans]QEH48143.1 hypothetical protein FXN59_11795 [Aggregatibacter actinomycetemcomitans]QEH50140.1 hypothetical protein FXN57_11505 [Aggregatibacter actinomycetemcomitans]TYA50039.1 hypothetical protein FXB74_00855 [Aggregatibacter actinomycetemcomitans]TYA51209.1 hypothetical protein FXB81_05105 [Aggregatibacter actinomycetemcomitans]
MTSSVLCNHQVNKSFKNEKGIFRCLFLLPPKSFYRHLNKAKKYPDLCRGILLKTLKFFTALYEK